jgi:predicted nucleic acid-binding protein
MIVVDTNIISYFYLEGEYTGLAEKVYQKNHHWSAPLLWRSEFRNVLAMYIRKGIVTLDDASQIMREALLLMKDNEYEITSLKVLELVDRSNCSAYDCEFVSLALDLGVPLVTVDKKVLTNFPEIAIRLDRFVERNAE